MAKKCTKKRDARAKLMSTRAVVNFARASRASVTSRLLRVNTDFQCFRRCRRVLRLFPLLEDGDNHMSLE